MRATRSYTRSL